MTAMAGIIIALAGLAIVIVAFVSFVYPLPGLTTKRGRGWTIAGGYLVLLWGSSIIRQTVQEELREPFVTIPMMVIFGAFVLSCIALIRPLPSCWLPTRKQARYACVLSLGLMAAASPLLPEPPPPTPEELAAIAAEKRREAAEAEEQRRLEEVEYNKGHPICKTDENLCADYLVDCMKRIDRNYEACNDICIQKWLLNRDYDVGSCEKQCPDNDYGPCHEEYAWKGPR